MGEPGQGDKKRPPAGTRKAPVAPAERNRVRVAPLSLLKLRLQDETGAPLASKSYSISWRNTEGRSRLGVTDATGILTEPIPAATAIADIRVGQMTDMSIIIAEWNLVVRIGPIAEPDRLEGAAVRMSNLGYLMVPVPSATDNPSVDAWAAAHKDEINFAAMTYNRMKRLDPPVTYGDVFREIGDDHDKG